MEPREDEEICIIGFEVARIRLGGGPSERKSFWRVYREELALNQKTNFQNEHVRICQHLLAPLIPKRKEPHYFRKDRLISERVLH